MRFKKFLCGFLATAMLSSVIGVSTAFAKTKTIFIVGDSISCKYDTDELYALPRGGWGMYLGDYLKKDIEVEDLALSGRSSKSFTTEDNYKTLLDNMSQGDYIMIAFGHNDAQGAFDEDTTKRFTEANKGEEEENSFDSYLYNYYVKPAQEKGVTPIIVTTIADSDTAKAMDSETAEIFAPYHEDAVAFAKKHNLDCIDMTTITDKMLSVKDMAIVNMAIFKDKTMGTKGYDLHLNRYGANIMAQGVAQAMTSIDGLREYVDLSYSKNAEFVNMTRGEFVAEIVRLLGQEGTDNSEFADVKAVYEYAKAINTAKTLGLVQGDDKGNFNPNEYITNQDMFVILSRLIGSKTTLDTDASKCADYSKLSSADEYAQPAIAGVLNAIGDNSKYISKAMDFTTKADRVSCFMVYSVVYNMLNK